MIYGYKSDEFMPIRQDGELVNKRAFVAYKLRSIVLKHSVV